MKGGLVGIIRGIPALSKLTDPLTYCIAEAYTLEMSSFKRLDLKVR